MKMWKQKQLAVLFLLATLVPLSSCGRGSPFVQIAESTVLVDDKGSGTVVRVDRGSLDDVYILTAHHVVLDNEYVRITFYGRHCIGAITSHRTLEGEVMLTDSAVDLAIVRVTMSDCPARAVRVGKRLPSLGDRLWVSSYPGQRLFLSNGVMGGEMFGMGVLTNHLHYGSSGGGVYNGDLELVGIIRAMSPPLAGHFIFISRLMLDGYLEGL